MHGYYEISHLGPREAAIVKYFFPKSAEKAQSNRSRFYTSWTDEDRQSTVLEIEECQDTA
uniref:Uncharacterized protein n=2 Tax=Microplitis mediator bracovirus TaxID=1836595 RepID=A0A2I6SGU5_9VIRU|nr:hypothetical protein MmBV_CFP2 [Microplitis mediator bracovirus]